MFARVYDNIYMDKYHFEDAFPPMLLVGLYMRLFWSLNNYGLGFAYQMLKTQKAEHFTGKRKF